MGDLAGALSGAERLAAAKWRQCFSVKSFADKAPT
jgi:hypothetical protein